MKKIAALLTVAGLAAGANAQSVQIDLKVSTDGTNWQDAVEVLPGTTVQGAMFINWSGGYGFAGIVTNITGSGLAAGDSASIAGGGRQTPWTFGAATDAVYASGNSFRIDAASDVNNSNEQGIAILQNTPSAAGTNYSTVNPALVYRFSIIIGAVDTDRTITLESLLSEVKRGVASIHSSSTSTRGTNVSNLSTDGASIRVVPAPSALALLGLGGLVAGRRRR